MAQQNTWGAEEAFAGLLEAINTINRIREIYRRNLCGIDRRKEMISNISTIKALQVLTSMLMWDLEEDEL